MNNSKKTKIAAKTKPYKNIDFSGATELTAEQLKQIKPYFYRTKNNYKPIKKTVNIRIDADVLEWLKSAGKGYQTRLNAILREAMLHSD